MTERVAAVLDRKLRAAEQRHRGVAEATAVRLVDALERRVVARPDEAVRACQAGLVMMADLMLPEGVRMLAEFASNGVLAVVRQVRGIASNEGLPFPDPVEIEEQFVGLFGPYALMLRNALLGMAPSLAQKVREIVQRAADEQEMLDQLFGRPVGRRKAGFMRRVPGLMSSAFVTVGWPFVNEAMTSAATVVEARWSDGP